MSVGIAVGLDNFIVQKGELDSVDMDGDVVMMNIEKGKYYGFNHVGSHVWQLVGQPMAVKDVISVLLQEFDVDTKICEEAILDFVNKLYREELILVTK